MSEMSGNRVHGKDARRDEGTELKPRSPILFLNNSEFVSGAT